MILCIPNGYQPKKNCCQTTGKPFSARVQEVISREYNRSGSSAAQDRLQFLLFSADVSAGMCIINSAAVSSMECV